jgi:hypothetical protein
MKYTFLRGILFFYELVRLLALIGIFLYHGPAGEVFPWLAYLVPNALFFLMALFCGSDCASCGSCVPLYTAGKVMAAVTAAGWFVSWGRNVDAALLLGRGDVPVLLGSALCITAGDVFSIAGGLLLAKKLKARRAEPPAEGADSGGN